MAELQANVARYHFHAANLAPETFEVARFEGVEEISRLFRFELELVSQDPNVDFSGIMNQPATFTMRRGDGDVPVHGLVVDFQQAGRIQNHVAYRAVLAPRLWRLTLNHRSRIFQHLTTEEIVTQVLTDDADLAPGDFRFSLNASYTPREYCVQYKETDLAFISRLLEYEGIQFFFEHDEERETLVLTDDRAANPMIEGAPEIRYHPGAGMAPEEGEAETVREFLCREQLVTGKVILKDYNYRTPETNLQSESQVNGEMPGVRYDYGDHFKDADEGCRLARVRNEEIECRRRVMHGEGFCRGFRAGHRFGLAQHYRDDLNADYLLTRVRHAGSQRAGLGLATNGEAELAYENAFTCLPADVSFRPERRTPVPRVSGLMTANVVGDGDYAHLDDAGRYHAQMHFDLENEGTKPIRMSQPYTGKGQAGFHTPPHPETEMLWACVDGNPDRPYAIGSGPNPNHPAPVTSQNNSQHVFRTTSGNEFVCEDQQGRRGINLYTPEAKSRLHMGAEDKATRGIQSSTEATHTIHASGGVFVKAGEHFLGEDSIEAASDFSEWSNGVTAVDGALAPIWAYLGSPKLISKEFAAGVANAAVGTAMGLCLPGIYMASEGGVMMHTSAGISGYAGAGGIGFFTPSSIDLCAGALGVNLAAAAGGVSIGALSGGVQMKALMGKIEAVTKKDIIKLDAQNKSVLFHGKEIVGAEGEEQVILESGKDTLTLNADNDASLLKGSSGIGIEAKEQIILESGKSSITLDKEGKIRLKCGKSELILTKNGIKLKCGSTEFGLDPQDVLSRASNSIKLDARNDFAASGAKVNLDAMGSTTIKGQLNKIG